MAPPPARSAVRFAHAAPVYASIYGTFFDASVHFDAERTEVSMTPAELHAPRLTGDVRCGAS